MLILLALVYGAAVGAIAHYALPGRDMRGVALAPIWTAVVAGLVWLAFTAADVGAQAPWPWLVTAVVAPVACVGGLLWLTGARRAGDARRLREAGLSPQ